jgi:hypothetical protein
MLADISVEVAAHASPLILAGGEYFPVNGSLVPHSERADTQRVEPCPKSMFNERQVAANKAPRKR